MQPQFPGLEITWFYENTIPWVKRNKIKSLLLYASFLFYFSLPTFSIPVLEYNSYRVTSLMEQRAFENYMIFYPRQTWINFDDVRKVEGISFEDGFYYMTLDLEDSVYSTNGEIIYSDEYKRIVWDKNVKTLLFDMIAIDYDDMYYKDLAPFYKEEN